MNLYVFSRIFETIGARQFTENSNKALWEDFKFQNYKIYYAKLKQNV